MKIAYLLGSLNRGGTETLMLDVCRNHKEDEFEAIGIYRKQGVLENDFLSTKIPFYKLSVRKNTLAYLWKLRNLLLKNNVDIVHAQQPIDAVFAKFACIGTNIKIVLTLHGFDNNIFSKNKVLNFILKNTDKNIYVSNYQKEYYISRYKLDPIKQTVVYNGVSFDKFMDATEDIGIRKELNIPLSIPLIAMVGNFNDVRDQFIVCKFLHLLNEKNIDFHFLFIGKKIEDTPDRYDKCIHFCKENKLEHKVSFLGVRNDVPQILSHLDAFIYSTEHDTFGIAVVEAIFVGIPVFVNDWDVMLEITDGGKWATIYKTKDERDLFDKFMVFLQNKKPYHQLAKEASSQVKAKYSIVKHIENLKKTYNFIFSCNS